MSTSKDDYPGKRVIEASGRKVNLREAIEWHFREYENSKRHSHSLALRTLHEIAEATSTCEGKNGEDWIGIPPGRLVPVPWWVVLVISQRWADYIEADGEMTLDLAFAETRRGQGKRRTFLLRRTDQRHFGIASEIAHEIEVENSDKVTEAIQTVADRWEMSYDTARDIWKSHGTVARSALNKKKEG